MFRSLRWQLVAALGLVILLGVVLSGALSAWSTVRRFGLLVTEEGQSRAHELAPLLEASYAYWGDWAGLSNLLGEPLEYDLAPDFFATPFVSDLDWWAVSATALGMSDEELETGVEGSGSVAAVAEARGIDPEQVVQAIVRAEQSAYEEAVAAGLVLEGEQYLGWVYDSAVEFVGAEFFEWPDWFSIAATELQMDGGHLLAALGEGYSIEELALERNIPPEQLVEAILQAEEAAMQRNGDYTPGEIEEYLVEIEGIVWMYLGEPWGPDPYESEPLWTDEGIDWLIDSSLLSRDRLLVADTAGQVVFDSEGEMKGQMLSRSMLSQGAPLFDEVTGREIGTAIVAAGPGFYNAHQEAFLRGVRQSLLISGVLVGMVVLLVGLLLARRITAPVTALTRASRKMAAGDGDARVPVRSDDELGQMSSAFNSLAEELGRQRELRNRLVDDLSHELSTPLSVIQLEVEAARDGLQSPAEAALAVRREVDLLRRLVDDLELLAETGTDGLTIHPESVDLMALVREARDRWQGQADAAGVELAIEGDGPGRPLQVDPARIGQVMGNLLSNSLRHTPAGGRVTLRVIRAEEQVHVTVSDTGEGIPAGELPYVFERFSRTDRARSRQTGGRGLGLSIVRRIVELHGGRAWVESQVGEGTTFGFSLPLA
jgi:signal transduction histidine kinase